MSTDGLSSCSGWWSQSRLGRRSALGGLGAAGVAAIAAACGGRASPRSAGPAARAQAGTPRAGGTFNLFELNDFFDFDPTIQGSSSPNWDATMLAYDTLLDFDRSANVAFTDIVLRPRLAQKWETPDAQTYTLHLQPGVQFANQQPVNGRPLSAGDVKWTLEYLSRSGQFAASKLPPAAYGFALPGLESVDTPDDATVVVHFAQPYAPFLNYLVTSTMPVLAHEIYDQDGNFRNRMVGTGPYQLDMATTQKGSQWTFKKNPGYWRKQGMELDAVRYLILPDTASQLAAFRARQLDWLLITADATAAATVRQGSPGVQELQGVNPLPTQLLMNQRRTPLNDLRVRQAISLAVNHDEFDKVMNGGPVTWVGGLWAQDAVRKALKYDPAQAKSLLAAAGLSNGVSIPFLLADSDNKTPVQLLQSQLKQVGIDLTLDIVDKATRTARSNSNDFTMFYGGKAYGDPDSWLYSFNFSKGSSNRAGINDPRLDALILAERAEVDATKRADLIKQASVYIVDNAIDIPVYASAVWYFWQPYVKNYTAHWVQDDYNARDVWLDK
jgi:peptide/nickel transport system substrate-binding protein